MKEKLNYSYGMTAAAAAAAAAARMSLFIIEMYQLRY